MKLNNKGITTIEIIICFILVVGITISMYSVISTFNEKKTIESYKEEINTYKNTLLKTINDDFTIVGITSCDWDASKNLLECTLKKGGSRTLIVGTNAITYNGIDYPLPELDGTKVAVSNVSITTSNVLNVYIDLSHPDLENKYSIRIINPYSDFSE